MLFAPKEKGQGLVEYALILVLISIAVIIIMQLLGVQLNTVFASIIAALVPATGS
jgi:pilus assembly protein Flp/PilA